MPWIIHGFSGNSHIATQCVRLGIYLSFGKGLFREKVSKTFLSVPSEFVFFETDDDPNLEISSVYEKAAGLSGRTEDYWKSMVFKNFDNIFLKFNSYNL
ncbi:hypothetical protein FUAX_44710 (plasmid) [Fulvitalea axinellae]|uniref:Uncharacterized protein n=2 Tax=Fulvitalea axinellae TaxID=1182444 RepID=A0AAU9CZV4_9BACT|nr:hypothetical protein FUAX_44710 [Fulvitalea axinellae]